MKAKTTVQSGGFSLFANNDFSLNPNFGYVGIDADTRLL